MTSVNFMLIKNRAEEEFYSYRIRISHIEAELALKSEDLLSRKAEVKGPEKVSEVLLLEFCPDCSIKG